MQTQNKVQSTDARSQRWHRVFYDFRDLFKAQKQRANLWDSSVRREVFRILKKVCISMTLLLVLAATLSALFYGLYWNYPRFYHRLPVAIINDDVAGIYSQMLVSAFVTAGSLQYHVKPSGSDPFSYVHGATYYAAFRIPANFSDTLVQSLNNKISYVNNPVVNYFEQGRSYIATNVVRQIFNATMDKINYNFTSTLLSTDPGVVFRGDVQAIVVPFPYAEVDFRPTGPVGREYINSVGLIFLFVVSSAVCNISLSNWGCLIGTVKLVQIFIVRTIHVILGAGLISLALTTVLICFGSRHAFYHGWAIYFLFLWLVIIAFITAVAFIITLLGPYGNLVIPIFLYLNYTASGGIIPYELSPGFYQLGWALPMRHGVEGLRHIVLGTYSRLGLNIGVLLAWFLGGLVLVRLTQVFQINKAILSTTPQIAQEAFQDVGQTLFTTQTIDEAEVKAEPTQQQNMSSADQTTSSSDSSDNAADNQV